MSQAHVNVNPGSWTETVIKKVPTLQNNTLLALIIFITTIYGISKYHFLQHSWLFEMMLCLQALSLGKVIYLAARDTVPGGQKMIPQSTSATIIGNCFEYFSKTDMEIQIT